MLAALFTLSSIPDLTLARYTTLGVRGVDGVLDTHLGFLRLFVSRPNTSLHLFYSYDPLRQDGERMQVALAVMQDDKGGFEVDFADVDQLVLSSPLAHFYDLNRERRYDNLLRPGELLDRVSPKDGSGRSMRFGWCASAAKASKFMRTADHPDGYYTLPDYEADKSSRLYTMMRLMQSLDEPSVVRIDLYPTNRGSTIRDSLPLEDLWARKSSLSGSRDYAADLVERSYDDLLKILEGSPVFHLNIFSFAGSAEVARALVDSATSEAVARGGVRIGLYDGGYDGGYDAVSLLKAADDSWCAASLDGHTSLVPRVSGVRERDLLPGYVQVDVRARNFPHYDVQNIFTVEEAASLFRLPALNDGEVVQLRKETAPQPVKGADVLFLGADEFGQKAFFEMEKLSKHAFISGVPGSGKTNTMHHLASSLINKGVPILVLEPAKHEYRALLNARLDGEVRVFSPGGELEFPLRINPLEIPRGVTVGHHISRLCTVFEGTFPLEGALPFILDRSIEAVYASHGWDPKDRSGEHPERDWPTLSELYAQMELELDKESYGGEVKGNLTAALRVRIGGLLRRELGELFDVQRSTYEPARWLEMSAVVELEGLGRSEANFLTLLLLVLVRETLMVNPHFTPRPGSPQLRHVVFIEEAHNLIGQEAQAVTGESADPKLASTVFISDMLREVRAYSEGMIIADQLPTAIAPEVLKNTGLKIALRMSSSDDRELLGSMMAADAAQLERMAVANRGQALVLYEGLQRPFELMMTEWLGVPDTPEYVDPRRRGAVRESLDARDLAGTLLSSKSRWYRELRLTTVNIDVETAYAALVMLDQTYGQLIDVIQAWNEAGRPRDSVNATSARIGDALQRRPSAAGKMPYIDSVYAKYKGVEAAFRSRARGWSSFGFDSFASPQDVSVRSLVGRASPDERVAIYRYLSVMAEACRRYRFLFKEGNLWLSWAMEDGGLKRLSDETVKLTNYISQVKAIGQYGEKLIDSISFELKGDA